MKLKSVLIALALFFVLLPSVSAFAQSSTGTLEGTVLDANKLPVYNATVTAVQTSTKRTLTIKTSRAGVFSFPGLDAGTYQLSVVAPGFGAETYSGITVDVGGVSTQDFDLKIGSANDTVNVTADVDQLHADTSNTGGTISQDLIDNIPLPDHSTLGLATLIPGVIGDPVYSQGVQSENPGIFTNPAIPGASISIGGSRPGLATQLIDGFDITQNGYPRVGISFTPYAIKTISVQMAGLPAEYGRSGGGVINQASNQGGTQYHGTFEYRHTDPGLGQAYRTGSIVRSDIHQTIYGGVISGPVGIPKLGHLKDTFFLFTYEPLRGRNVTFSRGRIETPDELSGHFFNAGNFGTGDNFVSLDLLNSQTLKCSIPGVPCGYQNAVAAATCQTAGCTIGGPAVSAKLYYQYPLDPTKQLFPYGNKLGTPPNGMGNCGVPVYSPTPTPYELCIQGDDLSAQVAQNPVAQYIQAHYPTPSAPGKYVVFDNAIGSYDLLGNNSYLARGVVNHDDRYSVRLDHTFRNNDHLFVRYSSVPVTGLRYGFLGPTNPLNNIPTDNFTSQNYGLNYVHLFGSRIVDELRVSYIRGYRNRIPPPVDLSSDLGAPLGLVPATNGVGLAQMNFDDGAPSVGGGGGFQDGGRSLDESYGVGNETTMILGRHQLKFGGEFRALQLNRTDVSNDYGGTYNFAGNTASGPGGSTSALAAFDLGIINQFTTAGSQPFYYRWKYYAGFVQDSWKVAPNFTVNLGMRYNLEFPRTEKYNNQGTFDPNVAGIPEAPGGTNTLVAYGGLVHSGTLGLPKGLYPVNYLGFEPRVGFALAPYPFMVFRAAYALIHAPLTGVGNTILPAFSPAAEQVGLNNGGVLNQLAATSGSALDFVSNQPIPIARIGANLANPLFTYSTALLPQVDQANSVPYVESWNVGFQFQLGKASTVEATYVGQRGIHLYSPALGTNLPSQAEELQLQQSHANFNANVNNPYGLGAESLLLRQEPYQQFYNNGISQAYNRHSFSYYNGLYLTGRRSITKQLTLIAGFTWQKSLDSNSTPTVDGTAIDSFGLTYPQNPYTLAGDFSVSSFDQDVRSTLGYNYTFPFGRGQHFLASHRILSAVFGGFSTSGFFSAQAGFPLGVGEGNNGFFLSQLPVNNATPVLNCSSQILGACGATQLYNHLRPNIIPGVPLINPNWKNDKLGTRTGLGFLNQNAFSAPGSQDHPAYGNAPRTLPDARNPRSVNWDASLRKNIQINPRVRMQLYTDVANAANHPNFFAGAPSNVFSGALVNSTTVNPPTGPNGPFQFAAGFGVPTGFSGTRIINVGGNISF